MPYRGTPPYGHLVNTTTFLCPKQIEIPVIFLVLRLHFHGLKVVVLMRFHCSLCIFYFCKNTVRQCTRQTDWSQIPDVVLLRFPCCFQKISTGGKPCLKIFPLFLAASAASLEIVTVIIIIIQHTLLLVIKITEIHKSLKLVQCHVTAKRYMYLQAEKYMTCTLH